MAKRVVLIRRGRKAGYVVEGFPGRTKPKKKKTAQQILDEVV